MQPSYLRAIAGGFLATLAITLLMYYVAPLVLGHPMDIAALLGGFLRTSRNVGMMAHFVNGTFIFPLIFVWFFWGALPGGPTEKGVVWGLILWFLAQAFVMPIVGGGFFSSNSGGFMAVIVSLLGHLLYGETITAM